MNAVRDEVAIRYVLAIPQKKSDTNHIAAISRERMDMRKKTPHEKARTKSWKSKDAK
jgi:hypothetical protein